MHAAGEAHDPVRWLSEGLRPLSLGNDSTGERVKRGEESVANV